MSKGKSSALWAILIPVAIAAVLTVPVTTLYLFFRAFTNPTGSMEKTLLVGDYLVAKVRDIGPIQRGEIVVFHYPVDPGQTFIKRVLGVPGDRVRMINKQFYLNGTALKEPYIHHATDYVDPYRDNFPSQPNTMTYPGAQAALAMLRHDVVNGEVVVPPGKYFVLGDNRDLSLDSRYWGFVDRREIFGKPLFIYCSIDEPGSGAPRLRPERIFKRIE
jgi:signal peptidase I